MNLLIILISSMLVNNFVLSRFLGICPFLGVSKRTDTAMGMGLAVIFVITISSAFTYMIYTFLPVWNQFFQSLIQPFHYLAEKNAALGKGVKKRSVRILE